MRKKKKNPGILALKVTGLCLLFAVLAMVSVTGYSMIHKGSDKAQTDTEKQQLEKLDQLYQSEDYAAITGIIRTNNLYTGRYGKYWEIADVYYYQGILKDYLKNLQQDKTGDQKLLTKYLEYMISYGCISIRMADSYATTGADYGNRDVLKALAFETKNIFYQRMKFTESEVSELLGIKDGTQISTYAATSYSRLY